MTSPFPLGLKDFGGLSPENRQEVLTGYVCSCVFLCCPRTPKMELRSFLCFHKHSVRHLTLLLIEALDLQFSYANYFNNLKIAVPTSAFSFRCFPRMGGEGAQLE